MSTTTEARRSAGRAWLWVAITGCLAVMFVLLTLTNVPGVTRWPGGDCCKTEFVNDEWWLASFSLVIPIVLAARQSRLAGFAAAGVSAAAVWLIPVTIVNRYDDARQGDGLEGLTYVYAGLQILCFLVCAIAGARRR